MFQSTLSLLFVIAACSGAQLGQRVIQVSDMKQCPGKGDLPITLYNFTLERRNRTQQYLGGDVVFTEAFPNGFKMNLNIKACEDMSDKGTCKPFLSQLATNDFCLLLRVPMPSYKEFVRNVISPPLLCPLKSGTYRFRDYAIPNEITRYMKRTDKPIYYFNRLSGSKNGREIGCLEFFVYAISIKRTA